MIKRFIDDPAKTWEERFKVLEAHHKEETAYLADLLSKVAGLINSPDAPQRQRIQTEVTKVLRLFGK